LTALVLAALVLACLPATAGASESVKLAATLEPERLGHGTTVGFEFEIAAQLGRVPPPLVGMELRYPGNLGFALSGLGLATCSPARLDARGPKGCPPNSRMGFGSAVAEIMVEGLIVSETAEVTIVRGPTREGHLALLFYVNGSEPVRAQVVFPGALVPADLPFGGALRLGIPLVSSWPEGPDLAVVRLRSTLGPEHLTYYERVKGRRIAYNPKGILLPKVCPHGGFRFLATFEFLDGAKAAAGTTVPCPAGARGRFGR
jgi:hypothetical protein